MSRMAAGRSLGILWSCPTERRAKPPDGLAARHGVTDPPATCSPASRRFPSRGPSPSCSASSARPLTTGRVGVGSGRGLLARVGLLHDRADRLVLPDDLVSVAPCDHVLGLGKLVARPDEEQHGVLAGLLVDI